MLIDTHSHLNFKAYEKDRDEVIKRSLSNDTWMINIGSQPETSREAVELANQYEAGVYAVVGLHPIHTWCSHVDEEETSFVSKDLEFDYEFYKKLASDKKVVGIGECGLDYFRLEASEATDASKAPEGMTVEEIKKKQREVFRQQLKLAAELNKPAIIHCREAHKDVLKILSQRSTVKGQLSKAVMHCYSGDLEVTKKYVDMGLLISFTGLITFAREWDEVIKWLPLEKIMVETDCPYMTPEPLRGKRNEPMNVKYVAEKIAEIKGVSFEEVAEVTTRTAREFFGI